MMFWLTRIILKDLKLGFSEATVFPAFHPVSASTDLAAGTTSERAGLPAGC